MTLIVVGSIAGCETVERSTETVQSTASRWIKTTNNTVSGWLENDEPSIETQLEALFTQPYIDPLTRFLLEHQQDEDYENAVVRVRAERNWRCQKMAESYAERPKTQEMADKFKRGYQFSCPDEVIAFQTMVQQQGLSPSQADTAINVVTEINPSDSSRTGAKTNQNITPAPETQDSETLQHHALGECLLLTRINNYSQAITACSPLAETNNTEAQVALAELYYALGNYALASKWAEAAAVYSSRACHLLGNMYQLGLGVTADPSKAEEWFTKEAQISVNAAPPPR
jgi:hypothetical protein